MRSSFGRAILLVLALLAAAAGPASAQAPDTVLVNGKIVTVDDRRHGSSTWPAAPSSQD
jgi:hypothetical protein